MKQIAFFDFDGTITTKDTLLEIIKYCKGEPWFYFGFTLHAPFLIAYKAGLISNQSAKERVLRFFFGKTPKTLFQEKCDAFASNEVPALVRPKALKEIEKLKSLGFEVVIVSASADNWIKKWCEQLSLTLIATELEIRKEKITGKIVGKNCHGEEKVRRIKAAYNLSEYSHIYCYGDTSGDKPMLALGTASFFKPFR